MGGMEIINQTYYLKIKMGIKRAFPGTKLKDINKNLRASILLNSKGEARGSGELRHTFLYKKVNFEDIKPFAKWEAFFQTEISWCTFFETLYPVCDRISGSGSGSGQSGQYFPIRFRFRFRPNFGRIGRILKNNSKVFQNAKM